ncbi:AAA family ATPase [Poritiphilus flavus]|uniref:AAA family ATPase n=1 Tax=Poritiphilus flavus TaxID=2697053 RepID=A0A6L9EI56_9FLAO|nr:AAA family ATPase [Poritiphilus flavus]NAS14342.1 AAA family ATPase [Poritiphilus flavus]
MESFSELIKKTLLDTSNISLITGFAFGLIVTFYFKRLSIFIRNSFKRIIYKSKRRKEEKKNSLSESEINNYPGSNYEKMPSLPALYLKELKLNNIRCFSNLIINTSKEKSIAQSISILGDNSMGKSTILKAIALIFCNESDSVSLIKEMEGKLLKNGEKKGSIEAILINSETKEVHRVLKSISLTKENEEKIKQEIALPVGPAFICGYGTNRSRSGHTSYKGYGVREAVLGLFDNDHILQNPELALLRSGEFKDMIQSKLLNILLLDESKDKIENAMQGILFKGPWGDIPFSSLSDGYRSTTQWILDLISWMIMDERISTSNGPPAGVLLVDEIEQHLHPKWQRYIIQRICKQFPKIQVITTTHTPLVVAGGADLADSKIISLFKYEGKISYMDIDTKSLRGKRADQILTSVFEMATSRSPGSSHSIQRYYELSNKTSLKKLEKEEYDELKAQLEPIMQFGETDLEQDVKKAVSKVLRDMGRKMTNELDFELKKQLKELFEEDKH